jgi:hypothetical protein
MSSAQAAQYGAHQLKHTIACLTCRHHRCATVHANACSQAYQQLSSDLRTYGGVTGIPINPLKQQKLASAVYHQLAANLILPRVPLLATATNGTLVRTLGDVMLTLMIKCAIGSAPKCLHLILCLFSAACT